MADVKISGLPASTVPLAGTEVLPIVQGGTTKQVSVNNLTAGKTVLAAAFDTDVAAAAVTLSGTTLAADGTDTNINLAITPKGSGGLGINGSPTGDLAGSTLTAKFCVKQDESGPVAGFVKANNSAATPGATVYGCRSRGTLAAPTIVQNNDVLATYLGLGFDGTDLAIAADIEFQVDGTPGSNDMPGRILFKTTPDGTQTPVEALRINSAQVATFAQAPVLTALTASTLLSLDASKNISSVTTSATTPLGGTEEVAVVQGGAVKKVSIADVTAGRDVATKNITAGTTSVANTQVTVQASASSDANEPEVNLFSAVFANLNKPRFKSANGTLGLLVESGSTSSFQNRMRLRLDGGGAATATFQSSTNNGTAYTDRATLAGATGDLTLNTGNLVIGTSGKGIDFSATAGTGTSELLADYEEGTWTPAVTSTSGTITTVGPVSGTYTKIGRRVFVNFSVEITTNGTGAGSVRVSGLPYTISGFGSGSGRENGVNGYMIQSAGFNGATLFDILTYLGLYPGGNGHKLDGFIEYNV